MNVPKPTNKPFYFIVAGITFLAIPLTLFVLQHQTFFSQFAYSTPQSATSACDNTTGDVVINVSYTNGDATKDINVVVKDLQSGKSISLGTVPHSQTSTGKIDTGLNTLSANGVTFTGTWADNSPGSTTTTATYNLVSSCQATAVTNACPAGVSPNQGTCAWDPLTGAQGYQITVKETASGKVVQQLSLAQTASQSTFPMTPGISYTCNVAATNTAGVPGTISSSPAKTCLGTPTPTPNACPAYGLPSGYCRWDAVASAVSYNVTVKNSTTGQLVKSDSVNAPTTEYAFPDDATQTYQCSVAAVNACTSTTAPSYSLPTSCTAPTPTPTIGATPTLSPTPTASPSATPTPIPTATPVPTSTPIPTPTPVVVIRTVTSPPQIVQQPPAQTVFQQPGTQTIVRTPGTQTVIKQPAAPGVIIPTKPQPTMAPTGSTSGTYFMVGASAFLLLAGGLVFFIL